MVPANAPVVYILPASSTLIEKPEALLTPLKLFTHTRSLSLFNFTIKALLPPIDVRLYSSSVGSKSQELLKKPVI